LFLRPRTNGQIEEKERLESQKEQSKPSQHVA
jgi:hypothetical protein